MKKNIELDKSKKVFPIITLVIGIAIMLVQLITRQNLIAIVSAGYCIVCRLPLSTFAKAIDSIHLISL